MHILICLQAVWAQTLLRLLDHFGKQTSEGNCANKMLRSKRTHYFSTFWSCGVISTVCCTTHTLVSSRFLFSSTCCRIARMKNWLSKQEHLKVTRPTQFKQLWVQIKWLKAKITTSESKKAVQMFGLLGCWTKLSECFRSNHRYQNHIADCLSVIMLSYLLLLWKKR